MESLIVSARGPGKSCTRREPEARGGKIKKAGI